MPPNHHQSQQQQSNYPNYNSNGEYLKKKILVKTLNTFLINFVVYYVAVPPAQHQQNNYYGPQGNGSGGYDQSAQSMDQYSQGYGTQAQSNYNANGYSQYQQGYSQPSEYDQSQQYTQDYK